MSSGKTIRWGWAALLLITLALVLDFWAKHLAAEAAMAIAMRANRRSVSGLSDILSIAGLAVAGLSGLAWIISLRSGEAGSQLPFVTLICIYGLLWLIAV
jgi:hypothetical protein